MNNWWTDFTLQVDEQCTLTLPGLMLTVRHLVHEWQCEYRRLKHEHSIPDNRFILLEEKAEKVNELLPQPGSYTPLPNIKLDRQILKCKSNTVCFAPKAGNKPFVIRPHIPINLAPGAMTTIFVSTPVWVQVLVDDNRQVISDIPVTVPSDTWIGKDRMDGELCYAGESTGRLSLELLPLRNDRIITPVEIQNLGQDNLYLERFSLSLPHCSVFTDEKGFLWTERIRCCREKELNKANIKVMPGPPGFASKPHRIAKPRQEIHTSHIAKAVSLLFG